MLRFSRGVVAAQAGRDRMRRSGVNFSGDKLWTPEEETTLKNLYPDYKAAVKALGRSYFAIRSRARSLGLTPKRHIWTAAELSRLRRLYPRAPLDELSAAFPNLNLEQIRSGARYYRIYRARKPYASTRHLTLDQIRERAFELGYSMVDIDALARSRHYFQRAGWHSGHIHHRAIGRAIEALDGVVTADWVDRGDG